MGGWLNETQVMYAFHFYAGTHSFLLPRVREYASRIPIFCTEWGTSQANGDGGPFLDQAKAQGLGFGPLMAPSLAFRDYWAI